MTVANIRSTLARRLVRFLVMGIVSLLGFVVCVLLWTLQARTIQSFAAAAIGHETEAIARFAALESLVLSGLDKPKLDESVEDVHLRSLLDDHLSSIDRALISKRELLRLWQDSLIARLMLEPGVFLRDQDLVYRDANSQLFFPAILLPTDANGGSAIKQRDLLKVLDRAPQVKADIAASLMIAQELNDLKQISFGKWGRPVQTYFLTRTGVVVAPLDIGNRAALRSPTRVYFAQRPYFWDTVEEKQNRPQSAVHITRPYIDLVGKGPLFTVCHMVRAAPVSEAVVCLDFQLAGAIDRLKERLKPFQVVNPIDASCNLSMDDTVDPNTKKKIIKGQLTKCDNEILWQKALEDNDNKQFDFLTGSVSVLAHRIIGRWFSTEELYFSVPTGRTANTQNFLLFVIDVDKPRRALWRYGIFCTFFLLLLFVSVYKAYQERNEERFRLTVDLHNHILVDISNASRTFEKVHGYLENPSFESVDTLNYGIGQLESLHTDVEQIIQFITSGRPVSWIHSPEELADRLGDLASELEGQEIRVSLKQSGTPPPLARGILAGVYEVSREALRNAARHSGAKEVSILLEWTTDNLSLTVRDRGVGFDPRAVSGKKRHGLSLMRKLAKDISAHLEIDSTPGIGTSIRISVGVAAQKPVDLGKAAGVV